MIRRYSEQRLSQIAIGIVVVLTALYLGIGIGVWQGNGNYGVLPTYDLSSDKNINAHPYTSLIFFVLITLVEGLIFAYFLD